MKELSRAALLLFLVCFGALAAAWTKEDHEIFRLKDEVQANEGSNTTFYSFLDITPTANKDEINKAYRKLSRVLHPDKARGNWLANYNKPTKPVTKAGAKPTVHVQKDKKPSQSEIGKFNKEASARFERLSIVANILRGPERERYDHFLTNGFPVWRGTGYYYERFRPGLGTVLIGLFVVFGGGAHYAALYLGWKRQREFVERYIKHARRMAWGDEGGIGAIPGLGGAAAAGGSGANTPQQQQQQSSSGPADSDESMQWNRKMKRAMEKEKKRESKAPIKSAKAANKARTEGISTPVEAEITSGPVGAKKRTRAENGKILIVDSVGNVFLEEETEEGETQEFLLDVSQTHLPNLTTRTRASGHCLTNIVCVWHSPTKSPCRPSMTPSSSADRCTFTISASAACCTSRRPSKSPGKLRKKRESKPSLLTRRRPRCSRPSRRMRTASRGNGRPGPGHHSLRSLGNLRFPRPWLACR